VAKSLLLNQKVLYKYIHRFEHCQEQLAEANVNVDQLKSNVTSLQKTLEKYKVDMQFLENDKVCVFMA